MEGELTEPRQRPGDLLEEEVVEEEEEIWKWIRLELEERGQRRSWVVLLEHLWSNRRNDRASDVSL